MEAYFYKSHMETQRISKLFRSRPRPVPFDFFHLPIATYDLRLFPCCSMPPTFLILPFLNGQLKAGGINSFPEDRNRGYFLLEENKIIYGKAIIFFFCVFERNYFSGKFMSPSLGNPAPYPSPSVPELNNTTRFNQYRARIPSPFIRVVFIEENKAFPGFSLFMVRFKNTSHRPLNHLWNPIAIYS